MTTGEAQSAQLSVLSRHAGTPTQTFVSPTDLYTFPDALPGLPDTHRYALIHDAAFAPLRWLQSLEELSVCLPVLALAALPIEGYAAHVARAADEETDEELPGRILLVTRYDGAAEAFLVNLLAPLVLDQASGTGRQVILEGHQYPLRQPLQWEPATRIFRLPC